MLTSIHLKQNHKKILHGHHLALICILKTIPHDMDMAQLECVRMKGEGELYVKDNEARLNNKTIKDGGVASQQS